MITDETKQSAERLPVLRSIDQVVISRILRHDMRDAISDLLNCAYIQSIGKIGPFTAEDSTFLNLFLQNNKTRLIEIRKNLHNGTMKARDAEQEIDELIQHAKQQLKKHCTELVKLQLFIDQKKAEIIIKAELLKKIANGEKISESEASPEMVDVIKTEFSKTYNDTARILLASGKMPQQEGDGDLANLQKIAQGLLSDDAEAIQTLPEVLAQTTRDLFRLLEAVKMEVDRVTTLLKGVKSAGENVATPSILAIESQKGPSPLDKAKEWTIDNLRKNTVLWAFFTVLLENNGKMLNGIEVETLMRQKHPSFTSKIPDIHYDAKMFYEQHPAPFTLETGLTPNPRGKGRAVSTYGIFLTKKQEAAKEIPPESQDAYEEKRQQAIEWVKERFGREKGNNYWLGMFLAENFDKDVSSEQIEEYFKQSEFKQKTHTGGMVSNLTLSKDFKSSRYIIKRNRSDAGNAKGRKISTYRLTLKDETAPTQDDKDDDNDNGSNEMSIAIKESLKWMKSHKLDKKGSSLENLATFLASNYGESIPSHNEGMKKLTKGNQGIINRLIKRLKELNCPFQILVGTMPNPNGKGHPSNIYRWTAK